MSRALLRRLTQILTEPEKCNETPEPRYTILTYKSGNDPKRVRIVWAVVDLTSGMRVSPEYGIHALKVGLYALKSGGKHRRKHGTVTVSEYTRNAVMDEYTRLMRGGEPRVKVGLSQRALRQMKLMTLYFMRRGR